MDGARLHAPPPLQIGQKQMAAEQDGLYFIFFAPLSEVGRCATDKGNIKTYILPACVSFSLGVLLQAGIW